MRTSGQGIKIAAGASRGGAEAKHRRRFWRITQLLLPIPLLAALVACGNSSSSGTVTVTSVAVTPASASVQINTQATFVAQVNLSNNSSSTSTNTNVTWEVNGTSGGNATVGTIAATSADNHVAIYNAPSSVPSANNGQVNITAVAPQEPSNSSDTATVTSNTVVVTITVATGITVAPATCTAPARGTTCQFTALQNNVKDPNATWSVSNANCTGCAGSIDSTGLFTAPPFPPPGGTVTITATDGASTASATAQIVYSDKSLSGPFAFSYTGNDNSGFFAATGSLVSDGQGRILGGVEDTSSLGAGVSTGLPVSSGTYSVGEDGRGQMCLNPVSQGCVGGVALRFVMTTNEHAAIISFGANTTGSGSMDGQTLNDLSGSPSAVAGPYVFSALGADATFKPLGMAGRFSANGGGGIPSGSGILDVNDAGAVTAADSSLSGSYLFDSSFPNSGRGTLTLSSAGTGSRQFAFYIVDSTHLRFIETDSLAFLAGDIYSEPPNSFSTGSLSAGKYAFTAGGQASANSYASAHAAGGVFASDGAGNATGGILDANAGGKTTLGTALGSCAYTTDATTGRTDLKLYAGSGACPSGAAVSEFAAYPSAQGPWLLLELDSGAVATGVAYPQQTQTPSFSGSFALDLTGQGVFHNAAASYQPDAVGQLTISSGSISSGNFDVKLFSDPGFTSTITEASGAFTGADSTYGRGTVTIAGTTPTVSYTLSFYVIDAHTALLFDQDKNSTWVETGLIASQF